MWMLFPEVSRHAAFKYLLQLVPKSFPLLLKTLVISETFIGTRLMIPEVGYNDTLQRRNLLIFDLMFIHFHSNVSQKK